MAKDSLDEWREIINRATEQSKAKKIIRRDNAITKFMAVSGEDIDLSDYSAKEIEIAIQYILLGFDTDNALKYAVQHGETGVHVIHALSSDFGIRIK